MTQVAETPAGERVADTPPATPTQAIGQFGQDTPNNCSAIAIIKGMRAQWGRDAMRIERAENGGANVTMRDDYQVSLTPEQLAQARDASQFQGDGRGRNNAVVYQAAAAARMAQENGIEYADALRQLNTNQFPQDIARYYGVRTQEVDPRTLQGPDGTQYNSAIGYDNVASGRPGDTGTANHTALIARGQDGQMVYDHYGQTRPYDGTIANNQGVSGQVDKAFVLTDVNPRPGSQGQQLGGGWGGNISRTIASFTSKNIGETAPAAGRATATSSLAANTTQPTGTAPGSSGGSAIKPATGSSSPGSRISSGSSGAGSTSSAKKSSSSTTTKSTPSKPRTSTTSSTKKA